MSVWWTQGNAHPQPCLCGGLGRRTRMESCSSHPACSTISRLRGWNGDVWTVRSTVCWPITSLLVGVLLRASTLISQCTPHVCTLVNDHQCVSSSSLCTCVVAPGRRKLLERLVSKPGQELPVLRALVKIMLLDHDIPVPVGHEGDPFQD